MNAARRLRSALESALTIALALEAGAHVGCKATDDDAADASASAPPDDGDAAACMSRVLDSSALDACVDMVSFPCGMPANAIAHACVPWADLCLLRCPGPYLSCDFLAGCDDGGVVPGEAILGCDKCLGDLGRKPRGLAPPVGRPEGGPAAHFAEAARLERASIRAFRDLARHLTAHGAPRRLVRACLRSARDERRHALTTARLARGLGGAVERARVAPFTSATLEELVTENATAGCVREGFAALLALHQAARARDLRVAEIHARIADDEIRHAALGWAIHRWGMARLDPAARGRVRRAQASAEAELAREARAPWPTPVARVAGLPDAATALRLVDAFLAARVA